MRIAICIVILIGSTSANARVIVRPLPDDETRRIVVAAWQLCNSELYPEVVDAGEVFVRVTSKRGGKKMIAIANSGSRFEATQRKISTVLAVRRDGGVVESKTKAERSSPEARALACLRTKLEGKSVVIPIDASETALVSLQPQGPLIQDGQIATAPATAYVLHRAKPLLATCGDGRAATLTVDINPEGSVESITPDASDETGASCWQRQLKAKLRFPPADGATQLFVKVKK